MEQAINLAIGEDEELLRIGVLGAGWFASRRHIPDIQRNDGATLTALCRRDEQALGVLQDHFKPEKTYTDWRRMLDECPLDAVLIATPHHLHYEPARAALERGLHVLLEKPMTVKAAEAREVRDLAAQKDRVLGVALNPPYWAHCHRIRGAIQSGKIGDIEAISLFWTGNAEYVFGEAPRPADLPGLVAPTLYRADPEQCGGGYFMDGGAHMISELLWVTGLRIVRVACLMDAVPSDRRIALSLTLENGAVATITSIGNSRAGRRVRNSFGGSLGTITVEGFEFATTIVETGDTDDTTDHFREADLPPVAGPIANFVDAIRGHAPIASPAEHGVQVVEVLEAAYRSAETGQAVSI